MKLKELLAGVDCRLTGREDVDVRDVQFDSRKVGEGTLFVAQRGTQTDGHRYMEDAARKGAVAVVCEEMPEKPAGEVTYVTVADSSAALGHIASNFYGRPSERLNLVGVTGTNGKTTTVTLLHRMFRSLGYHAGLVSTIVNKVDEREVATTHTTPDALELNGLLKEMVDAGCSYVFMEVSSHAVVQGRVAGLRFAGGVFSNITHDHLDFHGNMANYIAAKKGFFDMLPREAWALTNADDRNGMVMVQNCKGRVYTYSLERGADFRCRVIEESLEGMEVELNGREVWSRLTGRFNAYNLTAIAGAAILCGVEEDVVLKELSVLQAAPGRMQYVWGGGVTGIVDYAHTPDALEKVIETVNALRRAGQELITVVGCGGDRDRTKRPEMAQIAVEGSDKVVLTSDNPRSENPDAILDEMESGLAAEQLCRTVRITDRRQAIRTACMMAKEGDIVLVAGKGHEKYQEVKGVRTHFDDVEELEKNLKEKRQ